MQTHTMTALQAWLRDSLPAPARTGGARPPFAAQARRASLARAGRYLRTALRPPLGPRRLDHALHTWCHALQLALMVRHTGGTPAPLVIGQLTAPVVLSAATSQTILEIVALATLSAVARQLNYLTIGLTPCHAVLLLEVASDALLDTRAHPHVRQAAVLARRIGGTLTVTTNPLYWQLECPAPSGMLALALALEARCD